MPPAHANGATALLAIPKAASLRIVDGGTPDGRASAICVLSHPDGRHRSSVGTRHP